LSDVWLVHGTALMVLAWLILFCNLSRAIWCLLSIVAIESTHHIELSFVSHTVWVDHTDPCMC